MQEELSYTVQYRDLRVVIKLTDEHPHRSLDLLKYLIKKHYPKDRIPTTF